MGYESEPDSEDFKKITEVFDKAVTELKAAGAEVIDPIVIPNLRGSLAKRAGKPGDADESFKLYFSRGANPPFKSRAELLGSPDFAKVVRGDRLRSPPDQTKHYQSLLAREELMTNLLKVMADNKLDAIVHKTVEHQPTLISQGINPPYVNQKGIPWLNTFLVFVPTITVPAGFTRDNLPAGITFVGRPYDDGNMLRLAYSYEQATRHRRPPESTPPLQSKP
jgi:Asp-tRNA(Asn)/Glu-tRNA(Gln) amidotransferase A subunit family amidase